ncbi:RimK family alpha-L-glutamate ligase [Patescibacteria group bacterium]
MKKPRFAIIGARKSPNTMDLVDEITGKGFEYELMHQREMIFKVDGEGKMIVEWSGKNLDDFDIFIFRTYSKYLSDSLILAEKLVSDGKIVIDSALGKVYVNGKMFEASKMAQNNISYPRTLKYVDFSESKEKLLEFPFPIIAKPTDGRQGQGVTKLDDFNEASSFLEKQAGDWMIQEYVPIAFDIRVFVVGGEVLGAMKRYLAEGDFRSNIALGAKSEQVDVSPELEKMALDATKAMSYDVAGVDIIESERGLMVLEVNSGPQWQGFKKTTGVNPAKNIIEYALEKYNSKK